VGVLGSAAFETCWLEVHGVHDALGRARHDSLWHELGKEYPELGSALLDALLQLTTRRASQAWQWSGTKFHTVLRGALRGAVTG
jgi:hypothetical protein